MIVPRPSVLHVLKDLDWSDVGFGFVKAGTWLVSMRGYAYQLGDFDAFGSEEEANAAMAGIGLEVGGETSSFLNSESTVSHFVRRPRFAEEHSSLEEYALACAVKGVEPDRRAPAVFRAVAAEREIERDAANAAR